MTIKFDLGLQRTLNEASHHTGEQKLQLWLFKEIKNLILDKQTYAKMSLF